MAHQPDYAADRTDEVAARSCERLEKKSSRAHDDRERDVREFNGLAVRVPEHITGVRLSIAQTRSK